jgi:hypothetical protein
VPQPLQRQTRSERGAAGLPAPTIGSEGSRDGGGEGAGALAASGRDVGSGGRGTEVISPWHGGCP